MMMGNGNVGFVFGLDGTEVSMWYLKGVWVCRFRYTCALSHAQVIVIQRYECTYANGVVKEMLFFQNANVS